MTHQVHRVTGDVRKDTTEFQYCNRHTLRSRGCCADDRRNAGCALEASSVSHSVTVVGLRSYILYEDLRCAGWELSFLQSVDWPAR